MGFVLKCALIALLIICLPASAQQNAGEIERLNKAVENQRTQAQTNPFSRSAIDAPESFEEFQRVEQAPLAPSILILALPLLILALAWLTVRKLGTKGRRDLVLAASWLFSVSTMGAVYLNWPGEDAFIVAALAPPVGFLILRWAWQWANTPAKQTKQETNG